MKRLVILLSLALVPLGLVVAAWQSYSYFQLQREVKGLEAAQQDLVDSNKRLVAEYSSRTSPREIEDRARAELKMDWPRQDQLINLKVKPEAAQ